MGPSRNAAASSSESSASSASSLQSIPAGPLTIAISGFVVSGSSSAGSSPVHSVSGLPGLEVREDLAQDLGLLAHCRRRPTSPASRRARGASRRGRCRRRAARASSVSRSLSGSPPRREAVRDGEQRVDLAQAAEEGRAGAGHVLHPHRGRRHLLRADELREPLEPVVGDRRHADVRLVRLRTRTP